VNGLRGLALARARRPVLASSAVETMLVELAAGHGRAAAVLESAKLRSMRLPQRLRFTAASAALCDQLALDDAEMARARAFAPPTT
jgi:hypothetical protein